MSRIVVRVSDLGSGRQAATGTQLIAFQIVSTNSTLLLLALENNGFAQIIVYQLTAICSLRRDREYHRVFKETCG